MTGDSAEFKGTNYIGGSQWWQGELRVQNENIFPVHMRLSQNDGKFHKEDTLLPLIFGYHNTMSMLTIPQTTDRQGNVSYFFSIEATGPSTREGDSSVALAIALLSRGC